MRGFLFLFSHYDIVSVAKDIQRYNLLWKEGAKTDVLLSTIIFCNKYTMLQDLVLS